MCTHTCKRECVIVRIYVDGTERNSEGEGKRVRK
jgi:hypothetical protein